MILFGFDPGGRNSFGWACLCIGESGEVVLPLHTGCTSSAPVAITEASRHTAGSAPVAVGIDAPLFWVDEGDRRADAGIRTRVCAAGGMGGTVGHVNALRGACLVQGVLAARQVAERWPSAKVTEAHPKALLRVHREEADKFLAAYLPAPPTEHERDAALAAYAAWAFAVQHTGWRDLVREEHAPFFPSGHTVAYWFPC
jgi:predicted nuclease with RNAse H fold